VLELSFEPQYAEAMEESKEIIMEALKKNIMVER
jgi:hypothetical protein